MTTIPTDIISAAQASEAKWHVPPASVSLAQWADESAWGADVSGKFNYGGITAKVKGDVFPYVPGTPMEPATLCWTHENYHGVRVRCQRWFKDFASPVDYFNAHAELLSTAPVYAPARAALPNISEFVRLMAAHYATATGYGATLMAIINAHDLTQYDGVHA